MHLRLPWFDNAISPETARVSGAVVRPIFEYAATAGVGMKELRLAAGIGGGHLVTDDIRALDFLALLVAGEEILEDPLFGLNVGLTSRVIDVPVYGLALTACLTYGMALRLMLRFENLAHDLGRTSFRVDGDVAQLSVDTPWLDRPGARHLVDYIGAAFRTHTTWLHGSPLPTIDMEHPFAPPPGVEPGEYERILGAPIRFGADRIALRFPAEVLSWRVADAEWEFFPTLVSWAERHLTSKKKLSPFALTGRIRAHIEAHIAEGAADLASTAVALGMNPRTLQRRLDEEGTSFSELVDDVRIGLVHTLLEDRSASLAEVSRRLGFRNQSSFTHAYRGWFDVRDRRLPQPLRRA